MRRVPLLAYLYFSFILLLGGCAYYNEKTPGDIKTITPQTVSWQRVSSEIFQPRCAICHGNGGAGVYTSSYQGVVNDLQRIQDALLIRKDMPADTPLTLYEQTLFTVWVAAGTPEGGAND